jgi:hypothetical protein
MSSVKYMAFGWLAVITLALTAFISKAHTTTEITSNNKGFAVVELFTSEGCSSCPPADAVVAKIEKESTDKPVYILAFHVDYWNNLGWKDVFSSADYSKRQHQYASWLKLNEVYTPQIVVNGKTEFVGSEEGTLRKAINSGLQNNAAAQITLSNIKVDQNKATLNYQTQGNISNTVLFIAVVQKSAQTKVARGENGGRTLSHVQIVRSLNSLDLKGSNGAETITLPKGFDPQGSELIAFLQNTSTGAITGATKAVF